MQTELNELKARHHDELSALRVELADVVDEYSTLSYNSRVVRVFDDINFCPIFSHGKV